MRLFLSPVVHGWEEVEIKFLLIARFSGLLGWLKPNEARTLKRPEPSFHSLVPQPRTTGLGEKDKRSVSS
jgi:hypothetical protein